MKPDKFNKYCAEVIGHERVESGVHQQLMYYPFTAKIKEVEMNCILQIAEQLEKDNE